MRLAYTCLALVFLFEGLKCQMHSVNLLNGAVFIQWDNKGNLTSFYATTRLATGVSPQDAWFAIGLNKDSDMVAKLDFNIFLFIKV